MGKPNGLTPEQCRAARAFLNWSRADLAQFARVSERTLADFERGGSKPRQLTEDALINTFEKAGVVFFHTPEEGIGLIYKRDVSD